MSSISDNTSYPNFCAQAANDTLTFKNFKQNTIYNDILEHVTYEEGAEYINEFKSNELIMENIDAFQINDTIGGPKMYTYNIGSFSPTTLRYIKILNDLSQLNLNDTHIVEIGAGYGGQYTVLRQIFKPKTYTFIDIPPVLKLIERYVTSLGLDDINLEYIDGTSQINYMQPDLIVSNYAFSECVEAIQDKYIDKIIKSAKHCYMIYNNMNGYNHNTFIKKVRPDRVKINKEVPQTHPKNVILSW